MLRRTALFFIALGMGGAALTGCTPKPVATVNGDALTEKDFANLCETATQLQPGIRWDPRC